MAELSKRRNGRCLARGRALEMLREKKTVSIGAEHQIYPTLQTLAAFQSRLQRSRFHVGWSISTRRRCLTAWQVSLQVLWRVQDPCASDWSCWSHGKLWPSFVCTVSVGDAAAYLSTSTPQCSGNSICYAQPFPVIGEFLAKRLRVCVGLPFAVIWRRWNIAYAL